jgi:hypothetical protein
LNTIEGVKIVEIILKEKALIGNREKYENTKPFIFAPVHHTFVMFDKVFNNT